MSIPAAFRMPDTFVDTDHQLAKKATVGSVGSQYVEFRTIGVYSAAKSAEQNREVKDPVEVVLIRNDKFCTAAKRVSEMSPKEAMDLAPVYDNFVSQKGTKGTLIKEWEAVDDSERMFLQSRGVMVVEQLAQIPDEQIFTLGPTGKDWRERARRHLRTKEEERREDSAAEMLLVIEENKKLAARLAALEAAELARHVAIAESEQKPAKKKKEAAEAA